MEKFPFEKINGNQIIQLDTLSLSQRLLMHQMLKLVRNEHKFEFNYTISLKQFTTIKRKLEKKGLKNYKITQLFLDLQMLENKQAAFIDEKCRKFEFTWLTNLKIDYTHEVCTYSFCNTLFRIFRKYKGKRFILELLDFMALESKRAKRLYRFLSGCKSRAVTTHRTAALLKYFFVYEPMDSEKFFRAVIEPAVEELNRKVLFTFENIISKIIIKDEEDFVEITFTRIYESSLPMDCKSGRCQ